MPPISTAMPGRLLNEAFDDALGPLARVGDGDPDAVVLLAKLLVLSGITMTIAGSSSPASGGEHLLSHYWDMINLRDDRPIRLHGAQVGVASVAMDALYAVVLFIYVLALYPRVLHRTQEIGHDAPIYYEVGQGGRFSASEVEDLEGGCQVQCGYHSVDDVIDESIVSAAGAVAEQRQRFAPGQQIGELVYCHLRSLRRPVDREKAQAGDAHAV